MNVLDVAIVVIAIAYAVSGFLRGFVSGVCTAVGLLVGVALGFIAVPMLIRPDDPTVWTSLLAISLVLVLAVIGGTAGSVIGRGMRDEITATPIRALDAAGGSVLTVLATLVIAWGLGYAASGSQIPVLSQQARDSAVLRAVDQRMPNGSERALQAFADLLDTSLFPQYLDPFEDEVIVTVEQPDSGILADPDVQAARASVVKVMGNARACDRRVEGSGFVYARDRVMTNAHVIAGVVSPEVHIGGRRYASTVVIFDPELDVAVLAVDGLDAVPLALDPSASAGDTGAVMGFPQNGPFDERPARIRSEERLRSANIYNRGVVHRQAFSLRALVRPGNSGGPLVSADGTVTGVIFAASISDKETGYALTAAQVSDNARKGTRAWDPVPTGACA